jgi:phosphoribosylformylglycinamidine synthase
VASQILQATEWTETLKSILGSWNVASKEWVIRQYDHEVQGSCVVKPLVGLMNDGPGDATVLRPVPGSDHGLAISCGLNPWYGDLDTDCMAASAIDEAVRNCVAVGADPARIAILDNFCWGNTDRPEMLGSLVRAALACRRVAECLGTPFISGKDSLNNEFHFETAAGALESIAIPGTLLISALGFVPDVHCCVTMDFKRPGNLIYLIGMTKCELGGSQFAAVTGLASLGPAPSFDQALAPAIFQRVHRAIQQRLLRACHDLSEGGLAVALAEMAFAGGCGAEVDIRAIPTTMPDNQQLPSVLLFSESNTRFLCEVEPEHRSAWEFLVADIPHACLGYVTDSARLIIRGDHADAADVGSDRRQPIVHVDASIEELKNAWQRPYGGY